MYEMIIGIDTVTSEMKKYHPDADFTNIFSAYNFANRVHAGQTRKSGEDYIMHPLRVARFLASWGGGCDLVCAALLHDVVEDCEGVCLRDIIEAYGANVGRLVDALTSLDDELHNMPKEKVDRLSDIKFQKQISAEAIYIKAADRLDNLNTIGCFPEHKKIKKAQHTREIIIPILRQEGAFFIINQLEDLCLQLEHPDSCQEITQKCIQIREENKKATEEVIDLFKNLFKNREYCPDEKLKAYLDDIIDFEYRPRSTVSIYRQVVSKFNKSQTALLNYVSKESLALHEIILIVSDDTGFQESAFCRKLYQEVLEPNGIHIVNYGETTYRHSQYFTLQDRSKNVYRLYVKTQTQYNHYMFGHLLDEDCKDRQIHFANVDRFDPHNTYRKKYKVFTRDFDAKYIDEGATMLDFAYAVHTKVGQHFDYALVDESKTGRKAYERLSEGDRIAIKTKVENAPKLKQLKYVRTSEAIEAITQYIQKNSRAAIDILEPLLDNIGLTPEEVEQIRIFFNIFKK